MLGRVPKNAAPFLGTRSNISESQSEIYVLEYPFVLLRLGWTGHCGAP